MAISQQTRLAMQENPEFAQWYTTLTPEQRGLIDAYGPAAAARQRVNERLDSGGRAGIYSPAFKAQRAAANKADSLESQMRDQGILDKYWTYGKKTGGLGQGATELGMLAAFAALPMSGLATAQTAATIPGQAALSSLVSAGVPASTISSIAASQGVAGLEAAASSLGAGAGAASVASNLAQLPSGGMLSTGATSASPYSLASGTSSIGATGTGFGTGALTAAEAGVPVGAGIGGGMGAGAVGLTEAGLTAGGAALGSGALGTGSTAALDTVGGGAVSGTGGSALSSLGNVGSNVLGAGGTSGVAGGGTSLADSISNLATPNTLGSIASGAASLLGASQASNSAAEAAAIQERSNQAALAETKRQFDLAQEAQMPWRTAGQTALGSQMDLMGLGTGGASAQLSELMKSPGYEFRLGEGQKALERSAAARGGVFSGAAGKALTQYGQNFATNEYGNRLSQLSSLSGQGQAAASGMAGLGTQYAGNVSNLLTGGANAQAAASIAQGNARQAGLLGAGSALSNLFNPPKAQPTLADLLKGGNYGY